MNKSLVLASLISAVALAACSKKEEVVAPPAPMVSPAPAPAPMASPAPMDTASGSMSSASAPGMAASQ